MSPGDDDRFSVPSVRDAMDADNLDEPGLGHVLREALHEDYADDDAIEAVLDGMSAAEAFSFEKALRRSQRDVSHVMANPLVGQGLRTALPAGAGALGTLIDGPTGTAIGSKLGTLAAGALTQAGKPTRVPGIPSSSSGGALRSFRPRDQSGRRRSAERVQTGRCQRAVSVFRA
ncbi:hypothetical protein [Microbispora sp. H10670]|uniref:hypothetical protein n=1 Tax=Microbispora sp. H10670 TaxID=2729108 RepID=UPI001602D9F0|nr:hypothetical protein [Microbispora sp. H10670]